MLTFKDCLGLCDLTEAEIAAIAEHEHMPEMTALEYGEYLIHTEDGELKIKKIILEDIEHAQKSGNDKHAKALQDVLKQFVLSHPEMKSLAKEKRQS